MQTHKNQLPVTAHYPNGKKKSEKNYKNNRLHGISINWYENGQKEYETNHKDGEVHGISSWWHQNGQKESVGYYVLDVQYACIFWDEEGKLMRTELPTLPLPRPTKPIINRNPKPQPNHANA